MKRLMRCGYMINIYILPQKAKLVMFQHHDELTQMR